MLPELFISLVFIIPAVLRNWTSGNLWQNTANLKATQTLISCSSVLGGFPIGLPWRRLWYRWGVRGPHVEMYSCMDFDTHKHTICTQECSHCLPKVAITLNSFDRKKKPEPQILSNTITDAVEPWELNPVNQRLNFFFHFIPGFPVQCCILGTGLVSVYSNLLLGPSSPCTTPHPRGEWESWL